ncbi:uncharacterized protein LOC131805085 [Musca domestica]|uniref:Uncharacterized protein LOC131805085 n=1 Tax=Musca domestica TaxID=7370 RepID=A0ABM3VET5_MUSDO|nr:uncharacterized protein LOC131805085 [Musca domestica]
MAREGAGNDFTEDQWEQSGEDFNKAQMQITELLTSLEAAQRKSVMVEKIKIPEFSGRREDWNSFYELFRTLVHEDKNASDQEKLFRLRSALKGDALQIIQNMPLTSSAYEGALEALRKRYDNKRTLFTHYVDSLLDVPKINGSSVHSIKKLLDTAIESIEGIKSMNLKLGDAYPILAHIIVRKLDKETLLQYEQTIQKCTEIQDINDVLKFLEQRYQTLNSVWSIDDGDKQRFKRQYSFEVAATNSEENQIKCGYCKSFGHKIHQCQQYKTLTVKERIDWVRRNELCTNCLNHKATRRCISKTNCFMCNGRHHTSLHIEKSASGGNKGKSTFTTIKEMHHVLIATAQIRVKSKQNEYITLRALIDPCAQASSISEEAVQILQLPKQRTDVTLHGLGGAVVGKAKSKVIIEVKPRFLSDFAVNIEAVVLPELASVQQDPTCEYDIDKWENFTLADPDFTSSDRIDVLIGSDVYHEILQDGIHKKDSILAQRTKLGWILSGPTTEKKGSSKKIVATTTLERFWEIEEVSDNQAVTEDDFCISNYGSTTSLANDGRFMVRLPFREDVELGDSRKRAMARFLNIEKKLCANPELKMEYQQFMEEYISMGHMERVEPEIRGKYYLPHQAVIRESSITTKVRVVFDASSKTSNGRSLNDILYAGPRLQRDIFDILTKWRKHQFVISADVEKMYRQIWVHKDDQEYQYVLWRSSSESPVEQYRLTTVTYGTACAPFLALKTLDEIGSQCEDKDIGAIIQNDFYMDDLLTGADSISRCKELQEKINKHLAKYGFKLRKWISNDSDVLKNIDAKRENDVLHIEEDDCLKTLGLKWYPASDTFGFTTQLYNEQRITKRKALSYLAKIFDPLGWLTPITITAKLFIQQLWVMDIGWDNVLIEELNKQWRGFTSKLNSLISIRIPRWLHVSSSTEAQLHGFADASEKAYAAVVYVKVNGVVQLVAAKSKVNPIKNRKTLPKLELCAANLLAKLMTKVMKILSIEANVFMWSDSSIALSWIRNSSSKDRFIRTRVKEIQQWVPAAKWQYVKSKENPADMGSRGISADKLPENNLWWNGPSWLMRDEESWDTKEPVYVNVAVTNANSGPNYFNHMVKDYSSFTRLKRVIAYVLRYIAKLRGKNFPDYLTVEELRAAEMFLIKGHQQQEFAEIVTRLKIIRRLITNTSWLH